MEISGRAFAWSNERYLKELPKPITSYQFKYRWELSPELNINKLLTIEDGVITKDEAVRPVLEIMEQYK